MPNRRPGAHHHVSSRKPEFSDPTPEDPVLERTFRGHNGAVTGTSFSPDMKKMVSVAMDSSLMMWNFKPEMRAYRYVGHEKGGAKSVQFSPNGKLIASGGKDRTIRLWTPTVKGKSTVIKGHTGVVRSVCFSSDGKRLLSASDDKTLKLWSVSNQKFIFSLKGHSNWVRTGNFSPDNRLVASGSDDKSIKIWDTRSMTVVHTFHDHSDNVNSVKFHPDGTCLAACSADRTIKIWDTRTHKLLQHYAAHQGPVNDISFHPSGNYLLSGADDGYMKVWDLREGLLFYTLSGHQGPTTAVSFSPEGDFFSSGGSDGLVMVWKTNFDTPFVDVDNDNPLPDNGGVYQPLRDSSDPSAYGSGVENNMASSCNAARQPSISSRANNADKRYFHEPAFQSPPIQADSVPPQIANSLEHIIRQIDVLTQTVRIMEQRLTSTEEQLSSMTQRQYALEELVSMKYGTQHEQWTEQDHYSTVGTSFGRRTVPVRRTRDPNVQNSSDSQNTNPASLKEYGQKMSTEEPHGHNNYSIGVYPHGEDGHHHNEFGEGDNQNVIQIEEGDQEVEETSDDAHFPELAHRIIHNDTTTTTNE